MRLLSIVDMTAVIDESREQCTGWWHVSNTGAMQ